MSVAGLERMTTGSAVSVLSYRATQIVANVHIYKSNIPIVLSDPLIDLTYMHDNSLHSHQNTLTLFQFNDWTYLTFGSGYLKSTQQNLCKYHLFHFLDKS